MMRFWNPADGAIRLAEVDIDKYSEPHLRQMISAVSQQPHIFNATLKDNLRMARPGASDKELMAALTAAQLNEFVQGLPEGLDTWLGEAGQRLSGGQARRVATARAILHNALLWVLDEPTEGLDPLTEKKMMGALRQQTAGRTLLLITHRLTDLDWMDQIVILDQGRVIARGNHAELLRSSERYAALHMKIG